MKAAALFSVLPKHPGDYRFAWIASLLIAVVSAPFIVVFKQTAPWLIGVPIALGAILIVGYELFASENAAPSQKDFLVTLPADFTGLKSYEQLIALEIKPKTKVPKGQLPLFPGFAETTPANALKSLEDEHGRKIDVINCDRYSALLVTYLLENLDKATEKSLAAGLARFGHLNKGRNDIGFFVHDKAVREAIKSDFRGNLVTLVSKGGEKVLKDLLKTIEAKKELERREQEGSSVSKSDSLV